MVQFEEFQTEDDFQNLINMMDVDGNGDLEKNELIPFA